MSRLTELISQAKAKDSQMGADLEREFKALSSRLAFGLNFERHRPEAVELPQSSVRKGDKVRVLPKRGSTKKGDQQLWTVRKTADAADAPLAHLESLIDGEEQRKDVSINDLAVVAEFRDLIYPGLVSTGKVQRGRGKPHFPLGPSAMTDELLKLSGSLGVLSCCDVSLPAAIKNQ